MILFRKIMRFCAAQKSIKITLEKKFNNACFFLALVRFHCNLSTLLKTLISFNKYENI